MKTPLIGITLDWQEKGTFSNHPHYALRHHYFEAVAHAGGLGMGLPYEGDQIAKILARCDGLLVPGGFFASPAEWYEESDENIIHPPSRRGSFDVALMKAFLKAGKPVLGICAGMQILNCVRGGTLHKNLHTAYETTVNHLDGTPATQSDAHPITITEDSLLHKITGTATLGVNSAHTEAIARPGENIKVSASASDGVVEAIEATDHPFALGLQWHPEFFLEGNSPHLAIFKAFVEGCR